MNETGHGAVGVRPAPFTSLFPPRPTPYPADKLLVLAGLMAGDVDTVKDGPDPEENLWVPAGYTYFGQFVDHDLTFDSTSSLDLSESTTPGTRQPTNLRTPRLDLDCVYGDGPDAQPFMYASDGATLLHGGTGHPTYQSDPSGLVFTETARWDLLRAPNGRAIIGDKRNDENSIVCQIQLGMIRYHNAVVRRLNGEPKNTWNVKGDLFASARNEVRWTYQQIVVEDFLPRIIAAHVIADLRGATRQARENAYVLYKGEEVRANLPREFVGAAYRYGHSGVRTGYRLNKATRLSIFPASDQPDQGADSLLGFDPLPKHHVIDDWGRFFPHTKPGHDINDTGRVAADDTLNPDVRLQFAYKLDPTLVDPLSVLPPIVAGANTTVEARTAIQPADFPNKDRPSLALLNLLRGNAYALVGGQTVAERLQMASKGNGGLSAKHLVVRRSTKKSAADGGKGFEWVPIDMSLRDDTPLWFYVLAEAQAPLVDALPMNDGIFSENDMLNGDGARTQLGWVGGRIVAEVIYGILDADEDSYVNAMPSGWKPQLAGDGKLLMRNLLETR